MGVCIRLDEYNRIINTLREKIMNFGQSISSCMGKYVTFSGRATRSEFWWFFLFTMIVSFVVNAISTGIFLNTFNEILLYIPSIVSLIFTLPSLAVSARRLHDIGRSGWWVLLMFTGIGLILLIIWWVKDTEKEENVYG